MYDEYGEPSETLTTHWNEHNDHADGDRQAGDEAAAQSRPASSAADVATFLNLRNPRVIPEPTRRNTRRPAARTLNTNPKGT